MVVKLDNVFLEERPLQYLDKAGNLFHFMDQTTFEEVVVSEDQFGDEVKYLQDNLNVTATFLNNQVQKLELPNFIIARITETEPGIKGDSARAGTKHAKIDTGDDVQVPLFIDVGELVKIDTRAGNYVERVKK